MSTNFSRAESELQQFGQVRQGIGQVVPHSRCSRWGRMLTLGTSGKFGSGYSSAPTCLQTEALMEGWGQIPDMYITEC